MKKQLFYIVCILFFMITQTGFGGDITPNQPRTIDEVMGLSYDVQIKLSGNLIYALSEDYKFLFNSSCGEVALEASLSEPDESAAEDTDTVIANEEVKASDDIDSLIEIKVTFIIPPEPPEFIWPVEGNIHITSHFGWRWDPVGRRGRHLHDGIDISVPTGTHVFAALEGRVVTAELQRGHGNLIIIEHDGGYRTMYTHLHRIHVKVGDEVEMGAHIADSGRTGWATGPHLHFSIFREGEPVNPLDYLHRN